MEDSAPLRILVQRIKDLPTIPTVLMKILSLSADSTANADDLTDIISIDPTISARLLRLSNSAFYGCRGRVTSISRAIMVLGFTEVKNLALGMSVFDAFSKKQAIKGAMSIEKLWKHSIATASLSKFLAGKVGGRKYESAFTGGLLHDIGKVVFLNSFREDYKKAWVIVAEKGCSISQAEEEVFKVDHATIGEWLCHHWQMPEEIAQCIKYHPNPAQAKEEHRQFASIVHLANLIARKSFVGYGGDELTPDAENEVLDQAGLSKEDLEEAEGLMEQERENIEKTV